MTKSRKALGARATQAPSRRRKKPTNRVDAAFEEVKKLITNAADGILEATEPRDGASKRASAKQTAADRKRTGRQRQASAKKVSAVRIQGGRQRQAAAKKAVRTRAKKS